MYHLIPFHNFNLQAGTFDVEPWFAISGLAILFILACISVASIVE